MPRFRIVRAMTIVALIALDLAAVRAWAVLRTDGKTVFNTIDVLGVGGLPMANSLGIAILVYRAAPGRRPFLRGFVVWGAVALALYLGLAACFTETLVMPYLHSVLRPLARQMGRGRSAARVPIFYAVTAVMLGLPQMALGLIGGLSQRSGLR